MEIGKNNRIEQTPIHDLNLPANPHGYWLFGSLDFQSGNMISSLVRTWHFRVCCGRWRQFWKRRKPLCCNGFWTHRPVLTSSISEKTRVQIEMRSAPKRSFFARWQENTQEENPCPVWLCGQPPWIKCKKNRLKTDYTKHPFGPKHRKESSL